MPLSHPCAICSGPAPLDHEVCPRCQLRAMQARIAAMKCTHCHSMDTAPSQVSDEFSLCRHCGRMFSDNTRSLE